MKLREAKYLLFFNILILGGTTAWPDVYMHIDSVRVNAPKIHNDSLIYTIDIHFLERPGSFWSYYDTSSGLIVIEFLDAHVLAPPVKFARGMPFLDFKVKITESEMALTKQVSRVMVSVDRGLGGELFWDNDVRLANNSTVRLVIWKEKASQDKVRKIRSRTISITVGVSLLVVFAVLAVFVL
jgi:hypothetical protein